MKSSYLLAAILLMSVSVMAQTDYEPQILILSPGKVKYDKELEKDIIASTKSIKEHINYAEQVKQLDAEEFRAQPANIRRMVKSEIEFLKEIDFFKQISFLSEQYLAYRFFEKFPNLLIELRNGRSDGTYPDLKKISEQVQLQYVLSFPEVLFYKDNGISYVKLGVQLYDRLLDKLVIDKTYIGDWRNPGFEFACEDSSLDCTVNNALLQALDNIIYAVASESPTLKKERKLHMERLEVLSDRLDRKFDKSFISNVISSTDSTIHVGNMYQALISEDESKFVAFFLEHVPKEDFKKLSTDNGDQEVNIINNLDIRDSGYLDNIPQTYAYIVKAVKYKGQWYYEKSNATFFEPQDDKGGRLQFFDNLQQWNFFRSGSTELNPEFWETALFKKVPDLRKDPDWKKYGDSIWKSEEEENRPYVGLYEIVANKLKKQKTNEPKHIIVH